MDNDFEMWKFTTSQNVQDQCFNVETASPKDYFDLRWYLTPKCLSFNFSDFCVLNIMILS
jgi:hypothetical protein